MLAESWEIKDRINRNTGVTVGDHYLRGIFGIVHKISGHIHLSLYSDEIDCKLKVACNTRLLLMEFFQGRMNGINCFVTERNQ